ncbi:hypothetical protein L345_09414, partial [Ophiophagus hannah]
MNACWGLWAYHQETESPSPALSMKAGWVTLDQSPGASEKGRKRKGGREGREAGREEGREEGRKEGEKEGREGKRKEKERKKGRKGREGGGGGRKGKGRKEGREGRQSLLCPLPNSVEYPPPRGEVNSPPPPSPGFLEVSVSWLLPTGSLEICSQSKRLHFYCSSVSLCLPKGEEEEQEEEEEMEKEKAGKRKGKRGEEEREGEGERGRMEGEGGGGE